MCAASGKSHFPECVCVFSWRSRSMRAGSEPQIPQRAGRVLWQQRKRKKQPHMCLCAENIAGNSSISEVLQLASVNFCLVSISTGLSASIQNAVGCLLFHSDPYLIYLFNLFTAIFIYLFFAFFLLSEICMQLSLVCFYFSCFIWSFHSSSVILVLWLCIPMAAALLW